MSDFRATLLARLRDRRAVPIVARHAIPVIGVFVLGWSVLETIAALFLDALSTLWLVGAMGAYFATKDLDTGEPGVIARLQFWAGVIGVFLFIAGILTFALAVPAMFVLPLVGRADVDPMTLLTSGWLPRAFGLMVACQIPGLVQRVRHFTAAGVAPEKMGMDAETGFVLHRSMMLALMATMLAVFGPFGLPLLIIAAQTFGAGAEIMRDRYVGYLMTERRAATASIVAPTGPPPPPTPPEARTICDGPLCRVGRRGRRSL